MTQTPDLKRVQAALTKSEQLAKQLAVRFQLEVRKNRQLLLKYKEQERELQRLKFDMERLKRDLKTARAASVWDEFQ